jgi:molecular chaperone DnaK (HSP70)
MTSDLLGIDLGTTFSAMAVVDQFGKPTIVPNA